MRAPLMKDHCGYKKKSVNVGEGAQDEWEGAWIHLCDTVFSSTFVYYIKKVNELIMGQESFSSIHTH